MQTNYRTTLQIGNVGEQHSGRRAHYDALNYEHRAQVSTVTVGGTKSDGNFDVYVDGNLVRVVRTGGSPDSNDDIAAAIAAAINADPVVAGIVTATVNSAIVTLTANVKGRAFVLSSSTTGSTSTLVSATTTASSQNAIPVGVFVAYGSAAESLRALQANDTPAKIAGLVASSSNQDEAANDGTAAGYSAGKSIPVMSQGDMNVIPETVVAKGDKVYARLSAAGSEVLGSARNSPDGTAQVVDVEPTEANDTRYQLDILVRDGLGNLLAAGSFDVLSDSAATETEISTLLKNQIDAHEVSDYLTASLDGAGDDQSLQLTADSIDYVIEADKTGDGALTITQAVARVIDTVEIPWAYFDLATSQVGDMSVIVVNK